MSAFDCFGIPLPGTFPAVEVSDDDRASKVSYYRATISGRIAAVLVAMNTTPPRERVAADISRAASAPAGSIDQTLRRAIERGWVECRWKGRKRRRVYKLTAEGVLLAVELETGADFSPVPGAPGGVSR